jgi:hypothetical protein
MGLIPPTGTEISMGRISRSLGLTSTYPPPAGSNIKLNNTLGTGRNRAITNISSIPSGSQTLESGDFGGLDTPFDY